MKSIEVSLGTKIAIQCKQKSDTHTVFCEIQSPNNSSTVSEHSRKVAQPRQIEDRIPMYYQVFVRHVYFNIDFVSHFNTFLFHTKMLKYEQIKNAVHFLTKVPTNTMWLQGEHHQK